MATHRISIMGPGTVPDTTGETFMQPIDVGITTLGTFAGSNLVMTLADPSADTGFYGSFQVPENYIQAANIRVAGVLDGTVSTTSVDFEFSYVAFADNEAVDVAYTQNVIFNSGNTNAYTNEDLVILTDSGITDTNLVAGDIVMYYFKRDQGTDDFVGDFHVVELIFQYNDT